MEIEGIDKVYGTTGENYVGLMVQFLVGQDKEKAKIRLLQKVGELHFEYDPVIRAIDPDELPQISYSLHFQKKTSLTQDEALIYLRKIALTIQEHLRENTNITTLDIVGGYKNNIVVTLSPEKIQSLGLDILQVYQSLASNNLTLPAGSFTSGDEKIFVETVGYQNSLEQVKKIVLTTVENTPIYLEDVADVHF